MEGNKPFENVKNFLHLAKPWVSKIHEEIMTIELREFMPQFGFLQSLSLRLMYKMKRLKYNKLYFCLLLYVSENLVFHNDEDYKLRLFEYGVFK